ncbi:MAG: adenylate cyclase [Deltaproteobacteria bacterium]|nr:MAG: adenylate cyclase [Deltaproteobacteria bacterium]
MALEAESKFPVRTFSQITPHLCKHGQCVAPWYFEQNQVFDTPTKRLKKKGILLRLRKTQTTTLTLKHPLDACDDIPGIKQLEELQCHVDDAQVLASILNALGYEEILCYEKFRSQWQVAGCTICLDQLSFGSFVEIEGTNNDIFETAALIGLDPQTALSDTYHELFQAYLADKGLPSADSFVFSPQERKVLQHNLGMTMA